MLNRTFSNVNEYRVYSRRTHRAKLAQHVLRNSPQSFNPSRIDCFTRDSCATSSSGLDFADYEAVIIFGEYINFTGRSAQIQVEDFKPLRGKNVRRIALTPLA
jgi:hypothetical protein